MLLESKDIYNGVAAENDLKRDLIESIGNTIFKQFAELQRKPPDLILDLQFIGRRFIRKKELEEQISRLNWEIAYLRGKDKDWDVNEQLDELEILIRLHLRYEEFLADKREVKRKQYEFYASLGLAVPSLEVYKAGQDNAEEHQGLPTGTPTIPSYKPGDPTAGHPCPAASIPPVEPGTGEIPRVSSPR